MAGENVGGVSVLGFSFEDNGKIVPIRGHLDAIKSMMLGTFYIGRIIKAMTSEDNRCLCFQKYDAVPQLKHPALSGRLQWTTTVK